MNENISGAGGIGAGVWNFFDGWQAVIWEKPTPQCSGSYFHSKIRFERPLM
jgi:hypothetical protein